MSSVIRLFIIFTLFPAVVPNGDLLTLKCEPAVGIVTKTTVIRCSFTTKQTEIQISTVMVTKVGQENPVVVIYLKDKTGDQRFSFENGGPSLTLSNTKFSDEGEYQYDVITDSGTAKTQISISVTAEYKQPIANNWPENLTPGGHADLYCNATDGYPAGFIHWYDRAGTNWTINSILEKVRKDTTDLKSVALFSKLSFNSIDVSLQPFRCVVLNSKYETVGEKTFTITSAHKDNPSLSIDDPNIKHAIAGVVVIGSLIVGLLFALLLFRKRRHFSQGRRTSAHPILREADYEQAETTDKDSQQQ